MISFKNVTYKIKNKLILSDITFNIKRGEKVLIFGKSGSGKTTMFNLLLKNIKLTSGIITYESENINNYNNKKLLNYRQNEIIVITQKDDLFDNLTVFDNLSLFYYQADIISMLKKTKLIHLLNRYVYSLSGGERQRINIIKACLSNCNVLLCDEITSALDKENAVKIIDFITKLFKNKTIIFISHDYNLFINNIDKIIKIDNHKTIVKQINDNDNFIYKNETKNKKSLIKVAFLQGLKKLKLTSFIIFIINIICFYISFNFNDIFLYIAKQSYTSYIDYDVLLINDDFNNDLKINFIDIYPSMDNLLASSTIYIDNNKYVNQIIRPFNNKKNNSYIVLNSLFINKYKLQHINNLTIKGSIINENFNNIDIIEENNLFSKPCIYYDIKYFSKYINLNQDSNKYIINYDFTNLDNRFTNNPLYDSKNEDIAYLSNNAYYDYLTYKLVFDGISTIVNYFFSIILIVSIIISFLINISILIKDLKQIAIYISRGFSDFQILLFYVIPLIVYIIFSFYLLIFIPNISFSYVLSILIYLLAIVSSYYFIKQKSLNDLLKNEVLI